VGITALRMSEKDIAALLGRSQRLVASRGGLFLEVEAVEKSNICNLGVDQGLDVDSPSAVPLVAHITLPVR
jgi:hypothetical protein